MPGTYLTPTVIANEALMLLSNRIVGTRVFNRKSQVNFNGPVKIGDKVNIRRRAAGAVATYTPGQTVNLSFAPLVESSVQVQVDRQSIIAVAIDDRDLSLNINDFASQVLAPQVNALANEIDRYTLTKFKEIPTVGGTGATAPGVLPAGIADLALIDKTLNDQMVPTDGRVHVVSSLANAGILSIPNLSRVNESGAQDVLRRAAAGMVMNLDHAMCQAIDTATHTSGTMTSCLVNAASGVAAGATSIPFDTASGATHTLKKYDILTIAGYGNVVVAADVTASSSAGTVTIFDPLRTAVADNVAITVYDGGGNTRQLHGAAFLPDAFEFVAVPGAMPMGGATGQIVTDGNLSMRVIFGWNATGMVNQMTLDLFYGAALIDPRLACQTVKDI